MTTSVKGATCGYVMESTLIGLISILEIPPTYRKWPQLLIETKNCIYQRLENFVIPAMYPGVTKLFNTKDK
jgi:hypothetical protein